MASKGDFLTTREVSELLGIEARQVRALADDEAIIRVARGLFDRTSVEQHRAGRGTGRTRSWAAHTAWGAITMLSGLNPKDLGDTQTYRLRAALRGITDPAELTIRLRERATVTTWSGHRSVTELIRHDLVVPGRRSLGLVEDDALVDGYLEADQLEDLVRRYRLRQDTTGTITLRATTEPDVVAHLVRLSGRTLAAVDAATSLDPRERGAGEQVLVRRLELFRENVRP